MYKLEDGTELTEQVKNAFKRGLTRAYIKYDDVIIDQSNYLMNAKYKDEKADPETGEFIGITSMRELTIKLNNFDNLFDLENKDIEYHLGAKVGNEYKYINFGNFIVQKPDNEEVNEETTFTALDYMCKFDTDDAYEPNVVFPTTLVGLALDVCEQVGVELGNTDFRNADMPILANPFLNGENPRTVLKSIAKLSFSCCYIGQDNKLYFGFDWYEDELFTISNTQEAIFSTNISKPLDISLIGNTDQESTNGNQLLDYNKLNKSSGVSSTFQNDILTVSVETDKTYSNVYQDITDIVKGNAGKIIKFNYKNFTVADTSLNTNVQIVIDYNDGTSTLYRNIIRFTPTLTKMPWTIPADTSNMQTVMCRILINNSSTAATNTLTITEPLLYFDNNDTYEQYTGGYSSPSPNWRQPIKTVKGRNIFDKDETPIKKNNVDVTIFDNGFRITCKGPGSYQCVLYRLIDLRDYIGKTIRMKAVATKGTESLKSRYAIGLSDINGENRIQKATASNMSDAVASFVVSDLDDTSYYLMIWFYGNTDGTASVGDYIDYTNIIITIDNENMDYIPYNTIEVVKKGKNLLDYSDYRTASNNGITSTNNNDTITVNGTATSNAFIDINSNFITLKAGTYTLSFSNSETVSSQNTVMRFRLSNGSIVNDTICPLNVTNAEKTFTLSKDTSCKLMIRVASGVTLNNFVIKPMLEKGSTKTTYEPYYTPVVKQLSLGDIELAKIGTYEDVIFKNNPNNPYYNSSLTEDKWYKLGNIEKIVLDGSEENWITQSGSAPFTLQNIPYKKPPENTVAPYFICSHFVVVSYSSNWNEYSSLLSIPSITASYTAFKFRYADISTLEDFKTWLGTHNVTVYYVLEEPTYTEITDSTLIQQLEDIDNMQSYDGTTIITSTCENGNAQPYLDVNYYKREFPTDDENLAEEITVDGYFENKPNNQVKPITAITLRSSEIKASGQTIYDDELIEQYGTNELIIEEDYIAYTDTLRNAFLEGAKGLFGLTYKPLDIDLLGSVYLNYNDGIKVINLQGEEHRTFALNNNHEYNGTLFNTISAPALTETEEKYKYETEDKTFRRKTAVEIDKANQQIQSIVSEIGDRSQKQTSITQDIDSIELKISDIEDLTLEVTGNNPITLENCLEGELLQLKIKGNNTVFSGLVPSDTLVPSEELVPYGNSLLKIYTELPQKISDIMESYTGKVAFNFYGDMISNDNFSDDNVIYYLKVQPNKKYVFKTINDNIDTRLYFSLWGEDFFEKLDSCSETPTGSSTRYSPKRFFSNWTLETDWDYSIKKYIIETTSDESYIAITSWGIRNSDLQNIEINDEKIINLNITEPLRQYSSTIYDEFIYDYEDEEHKCYVIRRVGVTSSGTLYELTNESIEPIEIEDILLSKGTNYIDIGLPYIANCYAKYVQINEFTKQFATTYQVESAITQLANQITLIVREKVNKDEVIAELNLEISEGKGIVRITGNQVIIDSDYFHLTADGVITATAGQIGNLILSNGRMYKNFTSGDNNYQSGLFVPSDGSAINNIFLYAGRNLDTEKYNFRVGHNGVVFAKYLTLDNDNGYLEAKFTDSDRVAMALRNLSLEFRIDNTANEIFGKIYRDQNDFTIGGFSCLGICFRDMLHERNMYNITMLYTDGKPRHWFTGEMFVDRNLSGTFTQVAQAGDWSDARLKKDIKDSNVKALDIIDKLKFKEFTWNETAPDAGKHVDIGLIAQDLKEIDENYIDVNKRIYKDEEQELYSIDVLNLLTTATKAIQELNKKVEDLEEEIRKLKGEK